LTISETLHCSILVTFAIARWVHRFSPQHPEQRANVTAGQGRPRIRTGQQR
jgi:hypothetical protein